MRELFESTIERLLGDIATPEYVLRCEGETWAAELWSALEDSGFLLAAASEAHGGAEASWNDLYVILHAAGRFAAPVPLCEAILANWLLGQAGLDARSGVLTLGRPSGLRVRDGRVSGRLEDVPWGRHAEAIVSVASAAAGEPALVVLAPAAAANCSLGLNTAGEPRDEFSFEDAPVLAWAVLPPGLPADIVDLGGAMLRSAQIAGALAALLEMTVGYARERKQFGRPIGAFQAIQQQLSVLAEHCAAAAVAAEAACADSSQSLATFTIAVAKVSASEAASVGAGIAHSVHGAIGFTHEYPLHLLTRRLWSWRSEFGSLSFWSKRLGRQACAVGADGFWHMLTNHAQQALMPAEGEH